MQKINLYPLQPKQRVFANLDCKYRLFGWAKGWWKSYAMRSEALRQCLSWKKVRWLVLRRTSPEIRENMIIPMQTELPSESTWFYKMNNSDWIMTFFNGSTIRFSYCQNMKDVLRYQWLEYDFICIEELTHRQEDEFKILMWCLRSSRKWIKPNFFWSTNPWWKWHKRVKRLFVDRDFQKGEKPENYGFVPAFVWDNHKLMETQPEYVQDLESLPDKERKAYLEGDWNIFDWQYFTEFRNELHVIPPQYPIVGVKKRIVCLDYWYSAPSAVYWLALMDDNSVMCYRELYVTKHTYSMLALKVQALTKADEKISAYIVDPAIINKKSETSWTSWADEFKKHWIYVVGADNERVPWRQIVRKYLQPYIDPNTLDVTVRLKICSNCSHLISTLPFMTHDKTNVEDIDTTLEDHASDALRYWLKYLAWNSWWIQDIKTINDIYAQNITNRIEKERKDIMKKKKAMMSSNNILKTKF